MQGQQGRKASVDGRLVIFDHSRLIVCPADVVHYTSLDLQPVEGCHVIDGLDVVICEILQILILELFVILHSRVQVLDSQLDTVVGDTVTVSDDNLSISVTLGVIRHTDGSITEELLDLEVIANLWLNGEIAFLVSVIP